MRLTLWIAFWTFLVDQASKYLVVHILDLRNILEMTVFPPFLNLHMAWNRGVNFGLFSGQDMRWVLVALAMGIVGLVLYWVWRDQSNKWANFSAGLLVGGAIGNVVDRLLYGAVADFLNMSCCGFENPYAFNVADIAVFAGAIGLILFNGEPKASKNGAGRVLRK